MDSPKPNSAISILLACAMIFAAAGHVLCQNSQTSENEAGYIPIISGGAGYVHNIDGGVPTLEPQVDPVLLFPFGRHLLLESRTDFTGFFQRQDRTSGPFTGKVFKTVEFAELDWLANSHVMAVGGKYLLPFGLFSERLEPIWIRNLQDPPITATVGTRSSGAGDGLMLRGTAFQDPHASIQYSSYFSAHSGINQLSAARAAGGDASVFFPSQRLEIGSSYQRFLEGRRINSSAVYFSWQPFAGSLDVKAEEDMSYNGHGYWIEAAYRSTRDSLPRFYKGLQPVARIQEFFPTNGGGNSLPTVQTERFDFGLNYYLKDNLRLISSYGRSFSSQQNANVWNAGVTYRFSIPLWFGGRK